MKSYRPVPPEVRKFEKKDHTSTHTTSVAAAPVTVSRLCCRIHNARNLFPILTSMAAEYIYFTSRDEFLKIDISEVVYFEADGNYTKIIVANGLESMVCMSLSKMEDFISANIPRKTSTMARIGKRYIVNLSYIYRINVLQQQLVLSDQKTFSFVLSVSRDALKNLRELMIKSLHSASE